MATLLPGKPVSDAICEQMRTRTEHLILRGVTPTLSIVRIGERADDVSYETGAMKRCEKIGVTARRVHLPETVSQETLIDALDDINLDDSVHGCLLLRPLPKSVDENYARNRLFCSKDVDGMTDDSLAGVFMGIGKGYPPCTAEACIAILDYYGVDVAGKRVTVVGRSAVIGRPVAMLLLQRNATVTVCHTKTADLPAAMRAAEIVVVAAGRAGVVGQDCFSAGQTVLDVGIHLGADGRLTGDVRFAEAEEVVSAITPVPGGVGAVTTAVLIKHVVEAAERAAGL